MIHWRKGVVVAVGATALLLGACGGDDDAATSTEIETEATEFKFDPDAWSVSAGEEFTIEFTNSGSVEHEWAVLKEGEDIESEDDFAEDKVLFEVEAIPAGESVTESFTVEDAGTYQVICAIDGHFDAGMEGTLTVG
ncbi:MAG: cupredoxin domain-containing protein [Acidimicrobiales bacterium]|nr:cupredoxin domain-containing protein [Acidimicrobiales bacterium]